MIIRRRYSHYAIAGEATWQRLPAIRAINMLRAGHVARSAGSRGYAPLAHMPRTSYCH